MSFFDELKRRNVFRVGIAYIVAAWVLLQVADLFMNYVDAPDWVMHVLMFFMGLGFIAAVIVSWAYELTPEGIKRERDVQRGESVTAETGRKLDRIIIGFLALAVVVLLAERFVRAPGVETPPVARQDVSAETSTIPEAPAKSIAVLPFADLSQAGDQAWFADGLAEEILNALAKTPDLQVSSRTSTFRYKGSDIDIPDIAKELGVAHVLEGSVRSSGNRIRVTAQLIRAEDGFHVWSENYDRDEADMIEIQEDLARSIASALETTMDPAALQEMTRAGTRSVEAYKAYLNGIALNASAVSSGQGSDLLRALEQFEQARAADPRFAAAHHGVARFWRDQMLLAFRHNDLTGATAAEMQENFSEAIDLAIANAANTGDRKGFEATRADLDLRWSEALRLYHDYFRERPNDDLALLGWSEVAMRTSNRKDIDEMLAALRANGLRSAWMAARYVGRAYQVEDPSMVADFGMDALKRWPNHENLLYQTHRALIWARRAEEGAALARRYESLYGREVLMSARQACIEGRTADTEALLAGLQELDTQRWFLLKMLGRDAEATETVRQATADRPMYALADMLGYAMFDPRPFPSLMELLQREGIQRPPPAELPYKCPPPEGTSIAVLPFVNMSTDAENEFFSDGIAEEILNVLASIPELKVAARTSAFAYKGTNTKISQIAGELGVNHVLEGSVRKAGNQVRVTAQLIQASDGFHLWSDTYDRELTNIFQIQDEIAGSIADALKVTLKLEAGDAGNLTGTTSIEAYEHYLRGMQLWHLRTAVSLEQAQEEFEAAVALDPGFAKAHAGQALVWTVLDGYVNVDPEETTLKATEAADRALVHDPDNVEALAAKAQAIRAQRRYSEADALFRKAQRLNPSFATAFQWHGLTLGEMGRPDDGLAALRKAWRLDPRSRIIGYNLAWALGNAGRLEEANSIMNEVFSFAPDFPDGNSAMMQFQIYAGNCEEAGRYARRVARMLHKSNPDFQVIADVCQGSDQAKRRQALKTLMGWPEIEFANPEHPVLMYPMEIVGLMIHFGEFDLLFNFLDNQGLETESYLPWLRWWRTENGQRLQCDRRLKELEARFDIPPAAVPVACGE